MSAIYVMWVRQLKKYWRSKPRILASLAQPLLFLVAFGFGFGGIYQAAGGGNYIDFLAPGIIAMTILFTAMFTGIEVIWDRQFGFLKETLVAPVSRFSIFFGRTLGGMTIAMIQGLVVLLITLCFGFKPVSLLGLLLAILFMGLIGMMFTAFGTGIASRLQDAQAFPLIMNFIIMPVFFLSGALFPIEGLPAGIKWVSLINPLSYGIDALRHGLLGIGHFALATDFAVVIGVTALLLVLGSWSFSKIEI